MAQQDSDLIIREIEEDLRRERYEQIWKQYNGLILGAAFAVVAAVGGWKAYEHWQRTTAEKAGTQFQAALTNFEDGKRDDAGKTLETLVASGPSGYRALAQMRLAAATQEAGKTDEAVKAYDAIAADSSYQDVIRNVARIRAAMLKVDTADWTEMQNRLNDLKTAKGPWRYSAHDLLGLAAWKAGKQKEAETEYQALLAEPGVPQGLRQRAELMLSLLLQREKQSGSTTASEAGKSAANGDKAEPSKPK